MPVPRATDARVRPRSARARRLVAGALLLACACQWNERWGLSGRLVFSRDGAFADMRMPGPDPTGVSGVSKDVVPTTEDNIVEVQRVGGRVQVRAPGEHGLSSLDYFFPKLQTGPGGYLVTYPNSTVQLAFSDDTRAVVYHTGLLRFDDPAAGGAWIDCERLTLLEVTCGHEARFGGVMVPGGTRIRCGSRGRFSVKLERDRYFSVKNEGEIPVEVMNSGRSTFLRAADWMDIPVIRNAPGGGGILPESRPRGAVFVGEAAFPNSSVLVSPILPKQTAGAKPNKGTD